MAENTNVNENINETINTSEVESSSVAMDGNFTEVSLEPAKKKHGKLKACLAGLVILGGAYGAACATVPATTNVNGLVMNGVDLSGTSQEEAEKLLKDQYEKDYAGAKVTVHAIDQNYELPLYSAMTFNAKEAAETAFAYGHENIALRGAERIISAVMGKTMDYYPVLSNDQALAAELEKAGISTLDTTVQTTYELKDEELLFTKGVTGYSVDINNLDPMLKDAVDQNQYEEVIEAPLLQGTVEPLDMEAVYKEIHKKKKEATLDPKKNYKIVRSVTGIDFDKNAAKKAFDEAEEGKEVSVAIKKDKPKINTDNLKKHLFEATIGSCTTYVSGTYDRVSNVNRAASTINGTILMPGEVFSYNDRVGERTAANGYKKAPAYVNGKSVDELGGGVCQVSSTLYKAIVLANLEVVEHHNHTYESAYIGLGMDATVSWGGPEFIFKNNMDYPVKIVAVYSDGALTCDIVGAKLNDYKVLFTNEVLKTISHGTKYVDDKELEKGKTKVISPGHNGYVVQTYRTVVDGNGNVISKKKEDYNTYSKKDAEVARGTKPVAKKKNDKKDAKNQKDKEQNKKEPDKKKE